jgi:predicted ATPase with chaperone activity
MCIVRRLVFLAGLPDVAVKESQHRITSALRTLDYNWPGKQVIINMAPADLRKEGSAYDLPLAIGVLGADDSTLLLSHRKEGMWNISLAAK